MVSPSRIDLGSVTPEAVPKVRFELTNRGKQKLRVDQVIPDCGCAQAELPVSEIPPCTSVPLVISINLRLINQSEFTKRIAVRIADESGNLFDPVYLEVAGHIDRSRSLAIFPGRLDFGELYAGTRTDRVLYVRGSTSVLEQLPDRIALNPDSPTRLSVEIGDLASTISNKAVNVSYAPLADLAPGHWRSSLILAVSGSLQYRTEMETTGEIRPTIRTGPSELLLLAGSPASQTVRIIGAPGIRLSLKGVSASGPLTCQPLAERETNTVAIQVGLRTPVSESLPLSAEIIAEVLMSDEETRTIHIPVVVASMGR